MTRRLLSSTPDADLAFHLGPAGQVSLPVADLARAEAFYGGVLNLFRLRRGPEAALYDCGEVRVALELAPNSTMVRPASPIYFRVDDIARARQELEARGVIFTEPTQLVSALRQADVWIAPFTDPDGHRLALMMEGPKGIAPRP